VKATCCQFGQDRIFSYASKTLLKIIMNREIEFDLENECKLLNEIIISLDKMVLSEIVTFLDDLVLNEIVVYLKKLVSKLALLFLVL